MIANKQIMHRVDHFWRRSVNFEGQKLRMWALKVNNKVVFAILSD